MLRVCYTPFRNLLLGNVAGRPLFLRLPSAVQGGFLGTLFLLPGQGVSLWPSLPSSWRIAPQGAPWRSL